MLSGILGAAFLQSAGRAGKGEPVGKIILDTQFANPKIDGIWCTGEIKVSSIYNGEPLVETYSDLDVELFIQADANTQIVISGTDITECEIGDNVTFTKISVKNTALTELNCGSCYALTTLDVSKNPALTDLNISDCFVLTTLDVSKNPALVQLDCSACHALTALDMSENTALTQLNCNYCYVLTALDLSKNTALTELDCNYCYALTALDLSKNTALTDLVPANCTNLVSISYPATNEDVSTAIADAIDAADADNGTVYTDSAAAYYSTIATAATTKGWTIAQLPA